MSGDAAKRRYADSRQRQFLGERNKHPLHAGHVARSGIGESFELGRFLSQGLAAALHPKVLA